MSGARCQSCANGIGALAKPVGNKDEPLGTCRNCHSLACGHHAHRDPNVPEFICVECDPSLLAASAAKIVATRVHLNSPLLERLLAGYHLSALPSEYWAVSSLEDFQRRRPGYSQDIFYIARNRASLNFEQAMGKYPDERRLWEALTGLRDEVEKLLIGACIILRFMEVPPQFRAPHFHIFVDILEG